MRFLVVGAGGVGGYLGARLIAAGQDVTFVARGAHGDRLRASGLAIRERDGVANVQLERVVANARELTGSFDVALVCVKWSGLEEACDELARVLTPDGVVLPMLNGLDSEDVVARYVGAQRTLAAVAYMSSGIVEPGAIYVHGHTRVGLSPYRPGQEAEITKIASCFERGGVPVRISEDYRAMLWEKMTWNAPFNGICALTQKSAGVVAQTLAPLVKEAMLEVLAVARSEGVVLPDVLPELMLQLTVREYPDTEPSMLQDLRCGRPTEVDILQGAVAERGERRGVSTPVMRTLAALVRARSAP